MITSAGCNTLNYLLDDPATIHTVDINPKQNALLDLKLALINHGDHGSLFELFGDGKTSRYLEIYKKVRTGLSESSRSFWDTHIKYFSQEGEGLFYQGGAGMFARFLNSAIKHKGLEDSVVQLLNEPDQSKRSGLFDEIEVTLFNGLQHSLWKTPAVLSLAGIPKSQRDAIGDLNGFMRSTLRSVFVEQNPEDNYYWQAYLNGAFTTTCCPEYLKEQHFSMLQERANRIEMQDSDLQKLLKSTSKTYSHFVLLDHMDWLAEYKSEQLKEEWELILNHSKKGTKILFRTAYPDTDFLPDFIFDRVLISRIDPNWISRNDRVGTYTGTYLATVR